MGRKSINDFTSADIEKTRPFAEKYWREMGTKSPFFRAWFGDWRTNDKTAAAVVNVGGGSFKAGKTVNKDTGTVLSWGDVLKKETIVHQSSGSVASRALGAIEDIVENAILLDTYTSSLSSKTKLPGTAFMHSYYTVANYEGTDYLLKLFAEEAVSLKNGEIFTRAYELKDIKKVAALPNGVLSQTGGLTDGNTSTTLTVADIAAIVKKYDKSYNPKPASKVVNEDGTPKFVYHQTENEFTVFETRREGAGTRDNGTPFGIFLKSSNKDIGLRGKKQMALYARIENPLRAKNRSELLKAMQSMSSEYAEIINRHEALDREYKEKTQSAMREFKNYMIEWRADNPGVDSRALYDDAKFNELFEAEDTLASEWTEKADMLSTKAKEALTKALESNGYDGVILERDDGSFGRSTDAYIALRPEQVKSATDNIGTFDSSNPDIRYSLEPVKPIQPKNGEWERGSTTDEVRAKHPDLWAVDAESSESRNPTQISGTVKSYRKIYDALKAEGFNGTVLDASSGLGYGTRAGIEEYGFNVEDIEPFPDSSYKPKYTDYSKLHKKYDVIISNAVLNVLPQDQRDALVVKMGQMLNDGGRMFINVRGTDVRNASSKVPIDEANMEYYISNTGSYQKGFTKKELVAYLSDALGKDYTVVGTNKFGAVSAVVTKQAEVSKKFSREPESITELRRQNRELKKRVDYWKGQTQCTKVKIVRQSDVNRLAREVIDMSESDLKPQDITERLSKLGEHILNEKELRYTDIAEMAQDIAEDVVSNATTIVNEDDVQTHNRLRGYLKRVKLKDDGSAEFESIRNSYKRRIMFDKNGMSVDSAYAELNSMFGEGYFPEDIINPADQLERIAEVLDGTAPQYANPNGYYAEEAAEYMRNYIIDSMLSDQVRQTAPTMADKAAAREAKLKADNAERIKNAVKKERERNEVKLQRFKEGVARLDSKRKETALKNRYRGQIEKNVNTLSKWLLNPDHKNTLKHIPGQLQSTVRDFISAIDFTSSQQLGGGAPTIKDMKYIDSLDRLRRYIADSKVGEDRYSDLDLPPEFETQLADFVSSVNTLARNNKGTYTINDMTSEQLKELSDIVKTMKKAITDMNRLYQNATFQHVYEAGESDIETLREYTKTKAFTSKLAANRLDQAIMWESSRPAHVFKRFGKGGESMYQEFVDGQNTMAFLTKEVIDFAEDTYTTAEVKQWAKETHEFKFGDQRVKLTSAQLMSLYELNKRSQAKQHLGSGGFRVANFKDGKFNLQTDKEKHVFTDAELNEMFGELTGRQKEVADKLQHFMVERGGEWGNYVSRKRFDVEMFKDENYFPIKIDTTETDSKVDEKTDNASLYQLLNMGFTKETSAKANQSIVVYDIFDVFANHMSEMAQYRSFALPLLDMTKWFNIKVRDESGNVTASLRTEMRRAFGSDKNGRGFAEQFVTGIIKAYNGAEGRGDSSVNSRMINRVNRAAVAYNTRVMIQQPSAIVRAALYLDPKDLISSLKNYAGISTKQNIEEMHKHSGIALWKDLGFYDVNVSRGVQELIKHSQGTISKINEIGMKGAEFADKVTWAALWDASKKQVRRETGLSESDKEFFPKVSKVFENVIYNTQVVDTVLTKSEVSRNRSSGARLFTSFMSEPMTTASLVTSEIFDIQMKQAKGIKLKPSDYSRLSKTCIVVAVAAVVNSALASLADAWRDDDEYGTFGQKWTRAMRIKLADELNPLTYFPYASNVWDITKMLLDDSDKKWFGVEVYGNGTDIPLTDIINSSLKALEIFREIREKGEDSKYTKFGGYYKVVNVLSKITGIPLYNIAREGVSLYNIFASDKIRSYEPSKEGAVKYAWNDGYLTDDEAIAALQDDAGMDEGEAWLEVEKWKNDTTSNYTKLYDAIDNGGDIKKAVDELTEHGVEEKNIKSSLTRRYKDAYINGDNKEREKIRRALYATGVYGSVNEVIEKCNSWLKK